MRLAKKLPLLIAILLAGCTINPPKPPSSLVGTQGLVLFSITCGYPVQSAHIFRSGVKPDGDKIHTAYCDDGNAPGLYLNPLKLTTLTEGDYYIGGAGGHQVLPMQLEEAQAYKIHIEAGVINYIGHIEIRNAIGHEKGTLFIDINVDDRAIADIAEIRKLYPAELQKYNVVKNIARNDQKVVEFPQFLKPLKIIYSTESRASGEEGVALVNVEISAEGKAKQCQIIKSAGFQRLDDAAIQSLMTAEYKPAKNGLGQSVTAWKAVPMRFKLDGEEVVP